MAKVLCYSENDFKKIMKDNGWLNEKDLPENVAIISIIGSPDCRKYYLEDEESNHWFSSPTDNKILNLEFDDITEDEVEWNGYIFYPISENQAKEAVKFIEKNIGKDFYIHCRAGKSRSQAFVRFILDFWPEIYTETNPNNPCQTPNIYVLTNLKRIMWLGE